MDEALLGFGGFIGALMGFGVLSAQFGLCCKFEILKNE